MKKTISSLAIPGIALLFFYASGAGQTPSDSGLWKSGPGEYLAMDARVRWLKTNAVEVRTVNPNDGDFQDLLPLKKVLGDSRMVMLGEISHGDGTTFLAKSRLIKFLHQQMDFDVLVFESGFYDMAKVWESIQEGQDPLAAVQGGMMGVWRLSPQVKDLLEYVGTSAKSSHPLALAGFDLHFHAISKNRLLNDLDTLVARLGITSDVTTPGSPARTIVLNLFGNRYFPPPSPFDSLPAPDPAARKVFFDGLDTLRGRLAAAATAGNEPETSFWRQVVLSSLKSYAEMTWYAREHGRADRDWAVFNMRDTQNADNLLWLADHHYRGKKILVWGATMHLLRQASAIDATINPREPQRPYTTMATVGDGVWRRIGTQAFTIGFTCYEGSAGIGDPNDKESWRSAITKDQDPSIELEELFNATGFDYALVNFRNPAAQGEWLKAPIISRPLAHQGMRAVWPNVMDAMFYIRVMEPNLATRPR